MTPATDLAGVLGTAFPLLDGSPRRDGASVPVENPADLDRPVGALIHATPRLARDALAGAASGFRGWSRRPAGERIDVLARALALLQARREELARTITLECGKTLREALAEVDGALAEGRWQLEHLDAFVWRRQVRTAIFTARAEVWHEPLGPCLLVTPWNFPLSTVLRKSVPALACGNSVVLKPSELTPFSAQRWVEALLAAGLPPDAVQLLHGAGPELGPTLLCDPLLRAVSFTGSTATGRVLQHALAGRDVRLQAEMGGKNALVLLDDGDLEAALEATLGAAFACAGQWCTGTSRVIVTPARHAEFVERLVARVADLRVGDGLDPRTQMGPVITPTSRRAIEGAVEAALAAGAVAAHRHEDQALRGLPRGNWARPTVLTGVRPEHEVARAEVFGPVVCVLPCDDVADALRLVGATDYGLSLSVYTADPELGEWLVSRSEVGLGHVNLPTTFRDPALPFGGWRGSGSGEPECGDEARRFFCSTRSVYRVP